MFQKISTALSIVKNMGKILEVVSVGYIAISKSLNTLLFIESQINDTKLGVILKDYLPKTIEILKKVKDLLTKYGTLIGFTPPTESQNIDSDLLKELENASKKLDELLK